MDHLVYITLLMPGELKEVLDNVIKESSKKGLTVNCDKTECIVINKRQSKMCTTCWGC